MNCIGIICEYNPFHNGHLYHINKVKELFPDSIIILVLNGYFTQRGTASILSKEDKTKIALDNKVDIVLELPFIYGTQAADIFAYNSIKILNEFKVDHIVFGSESNDITLLEKIVDIELYDEGYKKRVKKYLEEGLNYPTSLARALNLKTDISKPNDLLAISYIKAIKKLNSKIIPLSIKRTNDYHDLLEDGNIISADNIRNKIIKNENIKGYLPSSVIKNIVKIDDDKFFNLLKYKIMTDKDLSIYLDVDEGIEYKIIKHIKEVNSKEELITKIKSKRYTYNKINRMLLHILIGLTKQDNDECNLNYIKILGFNKNGKKYLNKIKKDISMATTIPKNSLIYKYELLSSYLYEQLTDKKTYEFDLKNKPVVK